VFNNSHDNRAFYEIRWKHYGIVGQATDDNLTRRWIIKLTDTQNIHYLLLPTATEITRTRLNVMFIRTLPYITMHLVLYVG
jgi:hypothetical protein